MSIKGISVEWPGLADVSLNLTKHVLSELSPAELGIFVRLAHFVAGQAVNTYSAADPDPRLPVDDARLARIAGCSLRQWRVAKAALHRLFVISEDGWRLADDDIVVFSRRTARTPIPLAVRASVLARDGRRCSYCGDEQGPFHFDHLFPLARGGSDRADNIVVACSACNLSKSDMTLLEWVSALRRKV